jgi:hypothetical protein
MRGIGLIGLAKGDGALLIAAECADSAILLLQPMQQLVHGRSRSQLNKHPEKGPKRVEISLAELYQK